MHKKTLYTDAFTHRGFYAKKEVFTQMFCTKMLLRAKIKTYWRFYTQNLCHREAFAQNSLYTLHMFFLRKKTFDTEKLVHRDCTQKFLQTDFFTRRNFTQSSFYTAYFFFAQKPLRTKIVMRSSFYRHTVFTPHRNLTHRRFYAQHFLHTDAFTHRCLYTDTNCTQKLVHTARV